MEAHAQTLAHLRLVAGLPGYWEVRALARHPGEPRMEPRGSFFLIATRTPTGNLIYDRLEEAVTWADAQARSGAEVFVGMNPREREARTKDAVARLTACFVDLDLEEGETQEAVLAALLDGEGPLPSYVVDSGYGLHVVYLLGEAATDKATWRRVQRALVRRFHDWGADARVAGDESRILRLVPYPNRKQAAAGIPTALVYESEYRYDLAELAQALVSEPEVHGPREVAAFTTPAFHIEEPTAAAGTEIDAAEMERLVERQEGTRAIFEAWIKRALRPGLHFGIIPAPDGQPARKPTLLKPGAEAIASLFGWRFYFVADLDTLQMYGAAGTGVFAYVCHVLDATGHTIGQGRGVAELREPQMVNGNKAVKLAMKRAMVDAVLRCASLSEFFTQDLEDPLFIAPEREAQAAPQTPEPAEAAALPRGERPYRTYLQERAAGTASEGAAGRCTALQCQAIRWGLAYAGRSEEQVVQYYRVRRLEDLSGTVADRVLTRLAQLSGAAARAGVSA